MHKSNNQQFDVLSFNANLLIKELLRRNITCKVLGESLIVKATYEEHDELLYDVYTSHSPYPLGLIIDDKFYAKQLLNHYGFSVPKGNIFSWRQKKRALEFAAQIGYPVVVKPSVGTHGAHVYVNIKSDEELVKKIERIHTVNAGNGYFLIEKMVEGNEYRLFVTRNGFFAAVQRVPAHIAGDGVHTVSQLIEYENDRRMHPRNTCLCEIVIDDVVLDHLAKNDQSLEYIPANEEDVFLRLNSNVSTGGNCYEVTEITHESFKKLAEQVCTALNAPLVGLDVLTKQAITEELTDYAICELNGSPGLSLHMMPESGTPQNTAAALADMLFPETIV